MGNVLENKSSVLSLSRQETAVMKGIAICAMLCHHLYTCPETIGGGVIPYTGVWAWIGVFGKVCVALFLFCSGYGLAANYIPVTIKDDLKFVGRRLVKFYLNYWVIFLIFVPITIFGFHRPLSAAYGGNGIWWHLILDILGLQGLQSYNITWWFNTLIIILYLLFPLLYRLIKIKPWVAVLIGMIVMRLSSHVPFDEMELCTWQFPFLLGIVWKLYEDNGLHIQEWFYTHRWVAILGVLSMLVAVITIRMYPIIPHWSRVRIDGFVACSIALCTITIFRCLPHVSSILAFLGKHSMNIYMTHTFINAYWNPEWLHTCEWMRSGVNFVALMLVCLTVSVLIEYAKEKIRLYELQKYIISRI